MRRLGVLVLLATVVLVACGDGKDEPPPTSTPEVEPTATGEAALPLRPDQQALYVVNSNGSGLRKLLDAHDGIAFAVSPDGDSMALSSTVGDDTSLELLDAATGDVRKKVSLAGRLGMRAWSPDGRWLALQQDQAPRTVHVYSFQDDRQQELPVANAYFAGWSPLSDELYAWRTEPAIALVRVELPSMDVTEIVTSQSYSPFALSRDGENIAVGLFEGEQNAPRYIIALVKTDGSDRRDLLSFSDEAFLSGGHALGWSPDGRRLAYARLALASPDSPELDARSDTGVYVLDLDTGTSTRVTTATEGVEGAIQWSPDGQRLLVTRHICTSCDGVGMKLVVAPADGAGEVPLPGTESWTLVDAVWSPDGSRFAYGADALYVASADGFGARKLLDLPGSSYQHLAWSGDRIYFLREAGISTMYTVEPDGTGLQVVAERVSEIAPDGQAVLRWTGGKAQIERPNAEPLVLHVDQLFHTQFSPDSRLLAATFRDVPDHMSIGIVEGDGRLRSLASSGFIGSFRWSPDSTAIAYDANGGLWVVETSGPEPRRIANMANVDEFDWAPDGAKVAFIARGTVYAAPADGSAEPRKLFDTQLGFSLAEALRWAPDGSRIAVAGEPGTLYVFSFASGELRETKLSFIRGLAWSPDSSRLAFGVSGGPPGSASPGIYLLDVEDNELVQLTLGLLPHELLRWLPDGRVVFLSHYGL